MTSKPAGAAAAPPSFLAAFREYCGERFPVPVTFLLSVGVGVASYAAAQGPNVSAGMPVIFDGAALGGCLMVFLFLFHLRVFDEHKDFEQDAATRPDRPVQRGLISLRALSILGVVAALGQVALALTVGWRAGWAWLLPMGYSVLMFFEFFARDWLAKRIVWYALSHTAVAALFVVALALRFTVRAGIGLGSQVWVVAALAFVSFLGIDVLRKIWAPENEIEGVDSYSKLLGMRRAGLVGCAVLVAAAVLAIVAGRGLGGGIGWIAVVVAVTAWGCAEVLRFTRRPDPKKEKMMQVVAGVHLLVLFIGLAVVPAVAHGALLGIGDHITSIGVGR